MTSRINYNQPLKSVRTVRALKLEQYDPQKALDDHARLSDADLMHDAGVAFVWENAPGQSKVERDIVEASPPIELKPPPQALAQALAPPAYSKSGDIPKSPPPVPAGTQTIGRSFHTLLDKSRRPFPAEATVDATSSALPTGRSQPNNGNHHQLPPKPQQSGDKPPQPRRTTTSAASVSHSGHHSSALLSRSEAHDHHHQSARRTAKTRSSQELPVGQDRHHHSYRASTLHSLTNDEVPLVTHSAPLLSDSNEGRLVVFSPDQGSNGTVASGSDGAASSHSGLLSRGSQDYLSARLRQSPAVLGVKDFYLSGRHTPLGSTVPNSSNATLPNSCMPTRPNSASASEAGSQSDEGDNQTDLGDTFSQMNTRDPDGRCQVSVLNGEQHESSSRHTDPHARDFIMERFLPAAKAMVTEAADVSERRSSQETPLVSPTRRNGRSSLLGRSRFAFKDQFSEEDQEEVDQPDVLFKCKFPWQMGALRSTGPTDSGSAEQSPSPSFGNNKYSPSPTASIETRKGSSPRVFSDGQHDDSAWIYTESDGSARSTPKGDKACSFEERGLPPKSRNKHGIPIPRSQLYARETDHRDGNVSLGVIGEGANGECESEHSGRSNNSSFRASPGVLRDRLKETATQGDFDSRSGGNLGRRSPEPVYSGSLGTLLRTTQQQRRDLGRNSEAAIQAAVANVQEDIPPSSILNHHRNGPARAAAAAAAMAMTSNYGSKYSSTKPVYSGNGVNQDESNSYPRHLKVNLIRQQVAEPSGGSFESLNDEVWESARESLVGSDHHDDRTARVFTGNGSNLSEAAHDFSNSSGWPLVKVQTLYARTPSSDSKDASFSSVSERSLRSPTNLAVTIQQPSTEKYSPNSVLQPPLPKSPAESWLFKVRPPAPPSSGTNWQTSKPRKILDYSATDDSMDVKWEALVKSENAQLRSKNVQEVPRKGTGLEKSEILGSKAR